MVLREIELKICGQKIVSILCIYIFLTKSLCTFHIWILPQLTAFAGYCILRLVDVEIVQHLLTVCILVTEKKTISKNNSGKNPFKVAEL